MRHGSLFSGIGGFDLAAEWMGWENVFHCEWMEFPRKVLDYHFPNADSHIDICKTDFRKYEGTIDVISGGFPCQPFSLAGKRKGTNDERYLWGEMLRAIQEIKPTFVIAENVFGITNIDGGLVFQQVCLDLEGEGYEVQPFIIPACAKNAPHRRDRCWFIAYANDKRECSRLGEIQEKNEKISERNNDTKSRNSIAFNDASDTNIGEREQSTFSCGMGRIGKSFQASPWSVFPTEQPFCSGNDGLSERLDGITFSKWRQSTMKAFGNAIVPQIALQLFQILQEIQDEFTQGN